MVYYIHPLQHDPLVTVAARYGHSAVVNCTLTVDKTKVQNRKVVAVGLNARMPAVSSTLLTSSVSPDDISC